MSILKKLAGQTALYGLSSMIGRIIGFLLVPFYTGVLSIAEFGTFTYFYSYAAFLNVIFLFGMETTYFRFVNKDKLNELDIYQKIQTFVMLLAIFFSGTLIIFSAPISSLLQYPNGGVYVYWLALIIGIDAFAAIPFARLRQEGKAGFFASLKLLNIGLNIGLSLFFLIFCKGIYNGEFLKELLPLIKTFYHPSRDVELIFIANVLANGCMLPLLWKHFKVYRFKLDWQQFKPLFIYAYPLMFMGLAGVTNEVLDRILLIPYLPENFYPGLTKKEVLGIYGGCYKLSMFMTLAVQSFRYAADPFFFSKAEDKNAPQVFARVMNWFVAVCCFMFLVISVYMDPISELVLQNKLYKTGLAVVPVLLLANLFLGIYYNLSIWYKLKDMTYWGTWISFGGAFFTIIGNIILIPFLGYMGSAYTTLACYFLMALVSYISGNKYFPVPYDLLSVLVMIVSSILLVYLCGFIETGNYWVNQFAYLIVIPIYAAVVFYLKKTRFKNL